MSYYLLLFVTIYVTIVTFYILKSYLLYRYNSNIYIYNIIYNIIYMYLATFMGAYFYKYLYPSKEGYYYRNHLWLKMLSFKYLR